MKPIEIIRYMLILSCILVMFFNLFDCIIKSAPLIDYILYVGLFLMISILFMFIDSLDLIVWVIYVIATLTMSMESFTETCSYAVVFFCLITYLKRDLYFRVIIYFTTLVSTVCLNIFNAQTPSDMINVLVAYAVVYSLAELTYQHIRREQ